MQRHVRPGISLRHPSFWALLCTGSCPVSSPLPRVLSRCVGTSRTAGVLGQPVVGSAPVAFCAYGVVIGVSLLSLEESIVSDRAALEQVRSAVVSEGTVGIRPVTRGRRLLRAALVYLTVDRSGVYEPVPANRVLGTDHVTTCCAPPPKV